MKRLSFIFCLFCIFNCASAQDSLHEVIVGAKSTSDAAVKTEGLYVIDGKPVSDVEYKKLNPDDIFEVTLLSDSTATALYGASGANGAVSITTKKLAKKLYQTKLSAFSARYKNYIAKHGDDSNLLYVLNNTMLQIDKKLRFFYNDVQPGDIKKVNFKTDSRFKSDATVEIITNDAESE